MLWIANFYTLSVHMYANPCGATIKNRHYKETVVEMIETCPNQDMINDRKLIENCPKW